MLDPSMVFIDGTQIKASANKKKRQKELVAKTAKIYDEQLRAEVNAERAEHNKKPFDDGGKGGEPPMKEVTVSTTDPESGIFRKGEHETVFAYESHTACDKDMPELPSRCLCTEGASYQKTVQRHIWWEYLEIAEGIRKTALGKD